jgi:hypothetical protein
MTLLGLLVVIAVVTTVLWATYRIRPMDATLRKLLDSVAVTAVLLWLLQVIGVLKDVAAAHVLR